MSYSHTDARAQVPPDEQCQRCTSVMHSISPSQIHRWTCTHGLHMQVGCTLFVPLPDGRKAVPVPCAQLAYSREPIITTRSPS